VQLAVGRTRARATWSGPRRGRGGPATPTARQAERARPVVTRVRHVARTLAISTMASPSPGTTSPTSPRSRSPTSAGSWSTTPGSSPSP